MIWKILRMSWKKYSSQLAFACHQQYYQQNPRLVLLPQLPWSSSINRIHIQYCSDNLHGAVVTKESAFSTALTAPMEQ